MESNDTITGKSQMTTSPKIIAHQGGALQWPGNSRHAFEGIATRAVEGVELDIHLTADNEIVVIHDATLATADHGKLAISALSGAEVRRICGADGAGQTLADVLAMLRPAGFDIQIDIKTDAYEAPYPGLLTQVASVVAQSGLQERIILSSFVLETLAELRQRLPGVRLRSGLMPFVSEQLGGVFAALDAYRNASVTILDINLRVIDARIIEAAKVRGMEVGVGTVNGAAALSHWLRQPVDRILTDEPDAAIALRATLAP